MSDLLIGLLLAGWVAAFFLAIWQRTRITELEHARAKIELEESRMFDFLHELGSAFSEDLRLEGLQRLIVEAAVRIMNGSGGGLYLVNRDASAVLPSFVSDRCPPLVDVPLHILAQKEEMAIAMQCYLRRHPAIPGEGVIGSVWEEQAPMLLHREDARLALLREIDWQSASVMAVPLTFGGRQLGVLAVANSALSRNYDEGDLALFAAICEQSAFALYSAGIYSEAHEKRRLDQDLMVAQEVQRILLPSSEPKVNGFEICGINIPASRVSGDYYDYIRVDERRTGVVIADVSGKGVPASLIMAMCRIVLRSTAPECHSAAAALHRLNRKLYPDIKEDMFISMAYVILDDESSTVTLCRAGHDAPLHYSPATQTVSKINPPGMVVGIDSGDVFDRIATDFSVTLETDDCLVLYTDGVTEALDRNGLEFGMKNMIQSIQASASGGASAIVARLTEDLKAFIGTYPQNDDITLIVIRKT